MSTKPGQAHLLSIPAEYVALNDHWFETTTRRFPNVERSARNMLALAEDVLVTWATGRGCTTRRDRWTFASACDALRMQGWDFARTEHGEKWKESLDFKRSDSPESIHARVTALLGAETVTPGAPPVHAALATGLARNYLLHCWLRVGGESANALCLSAAKAALRLVFGLWKLEPRALK